jgi:alkylation response protein AidB-like acyl-CoA dehydrogenase
MTMRGMEATLTAPSQPGEYRPDPWQSSWLSHRSSTIWGGTAQVQRNIVGEKVLGLPKEPGSTE